MFLKDGAGRRPCFGRYEKMQTDPHFRDYLLFHEFFHGDNGTGLGASHQTGWTALVAKLLSPRRGEKLYDELTTAELPRMMASWPSSTAPPPTRPAC